MPKAPEEPIASLVIRARSALRLSQREFGAKLRWSTRTQGRMESARSTPVPNDLIKIGELVMPVEPDLGNALIQRAKAIAVRIGVALPEPVASTVPSSNGGALAVRGSVPSIEAKPIDVRHLVDAVVCAATDQGELLPRDVRPILLAAFTRAEELGLDFAEVRQALAPRRATAKVQVQVRRLRSSELPARPASRTK